MCRIDYYQAMCPGGAREGERGAPSFSVCLSLSPPPHPLSLPFPPLFCHSSVDSPFPIVSHFFLSVFLSCRDEDHTRLDDENPVSLALFSLYIVKFAAVCSFRLTHYRSTSHYHRLKHTVISYCCYGHCLMFTMIVVVMLDNHRSHHN